jgi:hypothetical protein
MAHVEFGLSVPIHLKEMHRYYQSYSTFAAAGGPSPTGKSWIGKNTDAIAGIALDIGKTANQYHGPM